MSRENVDVIVGDCGDARDDDGAEADRLPDEHSIEWVLMERWDAGGVLAIG